MENSLTLKKQLFNTIILLFIIAVAGTLGYHFIEKWTYLESLYMTVITISTVGYGEIHALSMLGKVFTIILIISSLGLVGFAFSALASFIIGGELNKIIRGRKMDKQIEKLNNHMIICGCGNTAKCVAEEFIKTKTDFVIIDKNINMINATSEFQNCLFAEGDATEDETLILAGIKRAKGLITSLSEDKDNVFVVLSARDLNPDLRIISRLTNENNFEKLKKAGADEIVSPNSIGGMRIASVMLRPHVVNFLDAMLKVSQKTLRMEEYTVTQKTSFKDMTLGKANIGRKTGLLVVAVKPHNDTYRFNPGADTLMKENDILIVMGAVDQLALLN